MIGRHPTASRRHFPAALLIIIAVQIALGIFWAAAAPLWGAHEADYYNVVRFLVQQGRLPTEADYPPGEADVRQATQPPLYFFAAAPLVAMLDDAQPVPPGTQPGLVCFGAPDLTPYVSYFPTAHYGFPPHGSAAAGYALRLLNLAFGVGAVIFTYAAGRALFPHRPVIALSGVALLAFEGNILRMITTISNDALLLLIAAANLYYAARLIRTGEARYAVLLLATGALAILTRLSGWAVFAFDGLVLAIVLGAALWRDRWRKQRGQARAALIALVLVVAAGAALAAFNLAQYGSIFGRYRQLDELVLRTIGNLSVPWVTLIGVLEQTRVAYFEPLDLLQPRALVRHAYGLAVLAGLIGVPLAFVRGWLNRRDERSTGALALLVASALIAALLVLFRNAIVADETNTTLFSTAFIFAPLRYYGPGLPALALLISAGLLALIPPLPRLERLAQAHVLGFGLAGTWAVVTLLGTIIVLGSRPPIETLTLEAFSALEMVTPADHEPASNYVPRLLGYSVHQRPAEGMFDVTLYAEKGPWQHANAVARVEWGGSVCEFLAARGTYPASLWREDEIVVLRAAIPVCDPPTESDVPLTFRWWTVSSAGEFLITDEPPLSLGELQAGYTPAASCPGTLGTVADRYRVIRYNAPSEAIIGQTYVLSVHWYIYEAPDQLLARVYVLDHTETGTRYQCVHGQGSFAPSRWTRGQTVFFDGCPFVFPEDAPEGMYSVRVGLIDSTGVFLPAVDTSGQPAPENLVPVSVIDVRRN